MEVNGYIPTHIRVFTNDAGEFKPQILTEAIHLDLPELDMDKVFALKEADKSEELFCYLIIAQCNALSGILPRMFQKINDYTELLLPDNLLRKDSVIERLVAEIPEEDWLNRVQIIGWLYQYYNTEPKDKVFADLKKNIKIGKEKIPAATQLFTPDWIVRYMVENSLGRLWLEGHQNDTLKAEWKYYLDEAEQEPEVQEKLAEIRKERAALSPENIRCIDPCMGSGHILCYLFDVLMQIYAECGYTPRDAVEKILTNNLYGLDIDDRAAQLAYFAVMMKARQYDRRFFSRHIQPKVMAIQESNGLGGSYDYDMGDFLLSEEHRETLNYLLKTFMDAKEYGAIMQLENRDYVGLLKAWEETAAATAPNFNMILWFAAVRDEIPKLIKQAIFMSQKYDVVVTNPPYMGSSNMDKKLSDFVKKNYTDYKSDLFSACMVKFTQMAKSTGYLGFLSPYVWMFISSYEKLRKLFIEEKTIETLIQFEYSAFEEATVPICTFVLQNCHIDKKGCYLRLVDYRGGMEVQRQKALEAISTHDKKMYFEADAKNFAKIPGAPVAYWVSEKVFDAFENGELLEKLAYPKKGLVTTDNERFIRFWNEVEFNKLGLNYQNKEAAKNSNRKWFPLNKGGEYRKWYGNKNCVLNWYRDGEEIKRIIIEKYNGGSYTKEIRSEDKYFMPSITWSALTAGNASFRFSNKGALFDSAGSSMFPNDKYISYLLGLLNTKIVNSILFILNPTLNYGAGTIANIPILINEIQYSKIETLVKQNISLSKTDWDSRETSWDFERHPLV